MNSHSFPCLAPPNSSPAVRNSWLPSLLAKLARVKIEPTCSTLQRSCWTDFGHLTAHHRGDLGPQQFDGLGHFIKGQAPDVDLPDEALVSKQFGLVEQFVDNLLRASDKERVLFPGFPLILRATERHVPDPFPSQRLEIGGSIRIERLQCLLGGLRYMDIAGHRDFDISRITPRAGTRPPIEIDQGHKASRPAANDAQIHGQSHSASSDRALWGTTNGNPDGQRSPQGARRNLCRVERRTEAPLPADAFGGAQPGQQVDLFRKQVVVVDQVNPKQLKELDEYAATSDDLGTTIGEQIQGSEILEDAHRIGGAQDGGGAGETDACGGLRNRGQDDRRR